MLLIVEIVLGFALLCFVLGYLAPNSMLGKLGLLMRGKAGDTVDGVVKANAGTMAGEAIRQAKSALADRGAALDQAKARVKLLESERDALSGDVKKLESGIAGLQQKARAATGEARDTIVRQGATLVEELQRKKAALAEKSTRFEEASGRLQEAWTSFQGAEEALEREQREVQDLRQMQADSAEDKKLSDFLTQSEIGGSGKALNLKQYKDEMKLQVEANRAAIERSKASAGNSADAILRKVAADTAKADAAAAFLAGVEDVAPARPPAAS